MPRGCILPNVLRKYRDLLGRFKYTLQGLSRAEKAFIGIEIAYII
jgi:hypothetical protein